MGKYIDITGQRYGRLTVLRRNGSSPSKKALWECVCDCGNVVTVFSTNLRKGTTQSCGCYCRERHTIHGEYKSRLYQIWHGMMQRCTSPNNKKYDDYGGRGISVCDEWHDFAKFREWAMANGYDESAEQWKCTLDRRDNDGNYCPENCRWVDMMEQGQNKRNNVVLTHRGESLTLSEWSRKLGIGYNTLHARIFRHGWSVDLALSTPVQIQFSRG